MFSGQKEHSFMNARKTLGRLPNPGSGFDIVRQDSKKIVGSIIRDPGLNRWVWKIFGAHPSSTATLAGAQDAAEATYNRLFL